MSTEDGADDQLRQAGRVDQGFLTRNSWLKPFALVEGALLAMLVLVDLANDISPTLNGRFSSAIFGMILAVAILGAITAAVVLAVNTFRHLE
ncbi:hypothetical protein [Haloarchaeobius sp. HRN-SO-5]|uniref:hypothetical protein n=1 Tax=Haloarchaeobius sp. HRN-SO-5 TaxID=3446118 RepID=UPI003EB89B67